MDSDTDSDTDTPGARAAPYHLFYCEENVWQLCATLPAATPAWATFISNPAGAVVMRAQKAGPAPRGWVIWDYHVVLLRGDDATTLVLDPDSRLGPCVELGSYLSGSFPALPRAFQTHRPRFRVVPAGDYLRTFSSDRSHMRDAAGRWRRRPPPWACLGGGEHNLARFIDTRAAFIGETMGLDGLRRRFGLAA